MRTAGDEAIAAKRDYALKILIDLVIVQIYKLEWSQARKKL